MILITEATWPSDVTRDKTYVWLVDLGNPLDLKCARQEMKRELLALIPDESGVSTSFSYTSHYMAMALSFSGAVGVDIEDTRKQFDFKDVAENFFTQQECRNLLSSEDFYKVWTAKEALIKAVGLGFAMDTQKFSLKGELDRISLDAVEGYSTDSFKLDTIVISPIRVSLCCFARV